jgi:GNAT superfamily N-acetyltransferase
MAHWLSLPMYWLTVSQAAPASASCRHSRTIPRLGFSAKWRARSRLAIRFCTVQLGLDTPPNQGHRADVKKMLVHRSVRGRGIGAALMVQIEEEARRRGRWLLVLDTVPGENGHRLYLRAGWQQTGIVPDYALFPDGRLCDTAIMWKRLDR